MGFIKSANAPTNVSPFSMTDIEEAAKRVLLRARGQAEALLTGAQVESEGIKAAAREEGFSQGHADGLARGMDEGRKAGQQQALNEHREKLSALVAALSAAVSGIDSSRRELEAGALREVVDLAIAIARRVTKRQGLVDPEVLSANVREAMKLVVHAADVSIAVHPDQRQTLEAVLPRLKMQWPKLEHVRLVEDASLSAGGCRIASGQGEVEADLDRQLDRVIADLLPDVKDGAGQAD